MIFGVEALHPKVSLLAEMGDLHISKMAAKATVCCIGSGYYQVGHMMVS